MNYEFEKNKLYSLIGKNLLSELKGKECYIAGGTITSLFCNREINDIDIYFKSEKAFIEFVESIWEDGNGWIVASTDKATLVKSSKYEEYQMIHFKFFPNAEDIFKAFDFTVCMGAFDFETETFKLHPDFLQHNSQRILKYNANTAFPIVSLLRVQKYKDKGYTISKPELIRIVLSCMNLEINTYEELKEQMGGMYGVNYDKLFKDKEGKVDIKEAIDVIANLSLSEDYFKAPESIGQEMCSMEDYLDDIAKTPIPYTVIDDEVFRLSKGKLKPSNKKPKIGDLFDYKEFLRGKKFYKFVKKKEGKYYSFYDSNFEYAVGKKVFAAGDKYTSDPVLYFVYLDTVESATYRNEKERVLIEVEFDIDDLSSIDEDTIELKACTMIREVPETEYKQHL
jgi:hypothetical protein